LVANFISFGGSDIAKDFSIIGTLLDLGVSPIEKDKDGETAFTLAKDKPEILAILNAFELKNLIKSTITESDQPVTRLRKTF
jgi:hypothetical protein